MTETRRREIAERFRKLIDSGLERKNALAIVASDFNVHRASIYRYCKRFRISTS